MPDTWGGNKPTLTQNHCLESGDMKSQEQTSIAWILCLRPSFLTFSLTA